VMVHRPDLSLMSTVMPGSPSRWSPYGKYLRFAWPLVVALAVLTVVVLAAGAHVP
jgi:uncharacterized ion transporter superfamily protein YfcC